MRTRPRYPCHGPSVNRVEFNAWVSQRIPELTARFAESGHCPSRVRLWLRRQYLLAVSANTRFCGCRVNERGEWLAPCAAHEARFRKMTMTLLALRARQRRQFAENRK